MQKPITLCIVLTLVFSATLLSGTQTVKAQVSFLLETQIAAQAQFAPENRTSSPFQQPPEIIIQPNGDINPPNAPIQKQGNIYTLTSDLDNCTITIERGDILLDGANHTLKGPSVEQDRIAVTLIASNVTVKNVHVSGWKAGVYGAYDNNTVADSEFVNNYEAIALYACDYVVSGNNISQSTIAIFIHSGASRHQGDNNLITQNQISSNQAAFDITNSNGTTITQNSVTDNAVILTLGVISLEGRESGNHTFYHDNFINNTETLRVPTPIFGGKGPEIFPACQWDNGAAGNYWGDYQSKYPNASEIGDSGIFNAPYVINDTTTYSIRYTNGTEVSGTAILGTAIDHFPLTNPVLFEAQVVNQPSPTPTTNFDPTPTPTIPEIPTWIIMPLLAATSILILTKNKRNPKK